MHISWARPASFCHLGVISDPLIVSKFQNETYDPKGQENKLYTIVKGRETFYTVPVTSCSEVNYVLKRVSLGSKDCTKKLKLECAYFLGQTSKYAPMCTVLTNWPSLAVYNSDTEQTALMRGSRKFCERGFNIDNGFCLFVVCFFNWCKKEDQNTTLSGSSASRKRNAV